MAPMTVTDTTRFMSFTYDGFIMKRSSMQIIGPTDLQTLVVMSVSLSLAAISVASALFAFYWFVRMRRGFRQDMIMLLIQSDMAKTLWLLISPLFFFITKKPFSSNWAFCQVSGFFLTVTIEASDIAVLLIAIHTALFIVKRQHPGVALGLQPYRRVAYALWAIVPIILAAVVPLTGSSFVDNGPHCYLPIEPSWYRNALAWVPRYIIFGFIIVTYTWLYLYVYIRFRRFEEDQRRASTLSSQSLDSPTRRRSKRKWRSHSVPPTPSLLTHNLLDSPQANMSKNDSLKLRQYSVASTVSTLQMEENVCLPVAPGPVVRKSSIAWNLVDFGRDGSGIASGAGAYSNTAPASPTAQFFIIPTDEASITNNTTARTSIPALTVPEPTHALRGENESTTHNLLFTRRGRWARRFTEIRPRGTDTGSGNSLANILTALRQGPPRTAEEGAGEAALSSTSSSVRLPTEVSEGLMRQSRDRMQRQMRLLFVYPAIYMLTWVAPFVAHVNRYDDAYVLSYPSINNNGTSPAAAAVNVLLPTGSPAEIESEPLALRIVSMASLCIGAAVDCGFFSAWERPWRHLRGGFWEGLAMRLRVHRLCGDPAGGDEGPGRNRDERVADERAARTRRDREREMAAAAAAAARRSSGAPGGRGAGDEGADADGAGRRGVRAGRRREWWDVLDEAGL